MIASQHGGGQGGNIGDEGYDMVGRHAKFTRYALERTPSRAVVPKLVLAQDGALRAT